MTAEKTSKKLAFVASGDAEAQAAQKTLAATYGGVAPEEADVIVALGGDGMMLQTMHANMHTGTPIFGMNHGSVGFLMNRYSEADLLDRLDKPNMTVLYPLLMTARDSAGQTHEALAINEVSLLRQTAQAAKLEILVDGRVRMDELVCDGILMATPAGSTAYNLSAHGPILPIDAKLMALTPISAFRPRRWRGALLPESAEVQIKTLESEKRPISAVADHAEFRDIVEVSVKQQRKHQLFILFDDDHSLDERVLAEQFMP